jgi:flagellar motor switch/type III secretory pathway protein FliN
MELEVGLASLENGAIIPVDEESAGAMCNILCNVQKWENGEVCDFL